MKSRRWLSTLGLLAALCLGCSFSYQLPQTTYRTGPTVTEAFEVSSPETGTAELFLEFGAGTLKISPGNSPGLLSGTATYNVDALKPSLEEAGNRVTLRQDTLKINSIPDINGYTNDWDLVIGKYPVRLDIRAGAYEGAYELGGLAIEELRVMDGAASSRMNFSAQNQTQMESLLYETGASEVALTNLGNANMAGLTFRGGVGDYLLDFSGDLQQDAIIRIEAGLSDVTVIVPEGVNARVRLTGGLAATTTSGGWQQDGAGYYLHGTGPTLSFEIQIGAGALELRTGE